MIFRRLLIAFMLSLGLSVAVSLGMRAGAPQVWDSLAREVRAAPRATEKAPWMTVPLPAVAAEAGRLRSSPSVLEVDRRQILEALKRTELAVDSPENSERRRRLIAQFIALDPPMALSYVGTLAGNEYVRQKVNAMGAWAARDPAAASSFFGEDALHGGFTDDEDRLSAAAIAEEWVARDPRAAFTWVTHLPEEGRAEAVSAMIVRLAKYSPQAALQMVESLDANYERAEAMQPLAEQWAQKTPLVAAAWVSTLRVEAEKNYAASGLLTGWMGIDAQAAAQWVTQLPAGSTRDAAIAAMVQSPVAQKNPESAATWAATIQDPQLRSQVLTHTIQEWRAQDSTSAERWVASQQ